MKIHSCLLCLALMLLTSCTSWHIKGEDSPAPGNNPLKSYDTTFRISRLNLQVHSPDLYQQNMNMLSQTKVSEAAIRSELYNSYPEFFSDSSSAFPIDIEINTSQQHKMSAGYFVLYMCTLTLIPAKNSFDLDSDIVIYPANPKHNGMFRLSKAHNTHMDQYLSVYFPTGWIWAKKAVGENEANSRSFSSPKQLKDVYLKTVCKAIVDKLSRLKTSTVEAVNIKHQVVE